MKLFSLPTNIKQAIVAAICLLFFAAPASALQLKPVEVAPGIYAFIGETGLRSAAGDAIR